MAQQITKTSALESLRRAVAERGADFVYDVGGDRACVYFDDFDGECSCIVGFVLRDHGYTYQDVATQNAENARMLRGIDMTEAARAVLQAAQEVQDKTGRTWGEALHAAEIAAEGWRSE